MSTVRLGVIGAGSWAISSHLPAFKARDEVEFVAVARHGAEALSRVADAFGFAVASQDYHDVLDAGVDVVLVASPSGLHHEHAKAALEAGAHVLLEKPVTLRPEDAWDLVETAERRERHVTCAFGWNFRPMIRDAKRIMTEHGIGRPEAVSIHMASVTRELLSNTGAYPDADKDTVPEQRTWTDPALSGGGYAQAQLSHALGMSLWLLDQRVAGAFALMAYPMDAPVELHDAVALRYDDGAIGTMFGASNWVGAGDNRHQLVITAYGSEGQVRVDVERDQVWLFRGDGVEIRPELPPNAGLYDCIGPVDTIVDLALGREVSNDAPLELGARTVEGLELAYRSARDGTWAQRADGA